ncbi:MAG: hypothetical protein R3B70_00760 [Polyangiaceae bacterium]
MSEPAAPAEKGVTRAGVAKAVTSAVERRVRWACMLSLLALGLILWSLVSQRPLPVIFAMTVGQVLGTLSLLFFLGSIALDVRARYRLKRKDILPPESESPAPSSEGRD